MAGRPTKFTPETTKAIIDAIRDGATYATAAAAAGVHYDTFNEWLKAGDKAKKKSAYSEFSEGVRRAEAECKLKATRVITSIIFDKKASLETRLKAALEYQKRRDRLEWGDNVKIDVGAMTDAELLRLLGLAQAAPAGGDDVPEA